MKTLLLRIWTKTDVVVGHWHSKMENKSTSVTSYSICIKTRSHPYLSNIVALACHKVAQCAALRQSLTWKAYQQQSPFLNT